MSRTRFLRPLTTAAIVALLATPGSALAASGAPEEAARTLVPEIARPQSLSGAYLAAKSAQREGDLDAAATFYGQALALDPDSDELRRDAMFAYLAAGEMEQAGDLADDLVESPEAGKVARLALGVRAIDAGDFTTAADVLALDDPSELDALLASQLQAWAELGAGRVDEALSQIDRLDGAPWYAVFTGYAKGLMAIVADRDEVARRTLEAVISSPEEARTSPDAYLAAVDALARFEARAGNREAALAAADKGLSVASSFEPLLQLRSRIAEGETVEPTVADIQDGAAQALYTLGQAINRGEGRRVAQIYFQLARSLAPTDAATLTALAGIAEQNDRFDQAIELYRAIAETSPYKRTAQLQIGLDLWRAERKDEAKAYLKKAVEDYPDDIQAYTAYADVLSADKDFERSAEVLNEAIALAEKRDEETWRLYYQRGIAYERTDRWEKAEADFKTALGMSPREANVLNYLGYSWVDMGRNLDEGLEMIKTAVDLQPNDGYIVDSLGWAYYRLGRFPEAVDELERAVLITPMDPTINDHLGDAYWRVGREREARFQWNRALEGDPKPEPDEVEEIRAKLETGLEPVEDDDTIVGAKGEDGRRAKAETGSATSEDATNGDQGE